MLKHCYALLIALAILTLALLPASCTCNCTSNEIPGGSWNPGGIGVRSSKIAYISDGDIYIMNADGGEQTRLTDNSDYCNSPVWSPDGTKIAFTSWGFHGKIYVGKIYVMNADGSGQIELADGGGLVWSPDGTKIAFTYRDGDTFDIHIVDTNGTNHINLTDSLGSPALNPLWSPDGTKILFTLGANLKQIYVMNADGSNQTKLAEGTSPAWSP